MEELLAALVFLNLLALIRVAEQLPDSLPHGVGDLRTLALDDHERNAVDEEDDIRDVALAAAVYAQLVDDQEVVVRRLVEIDEVGDDIAAAVPVGIAFDRNPGKEQLGRTLVELDQRAGPKPLQGVDAALDPRLVEPLVAVVISVDPTNGRAEAVEQEHLAEIGPLGHLGDVGVALDVLPGHRAQLLDQR